MQKKIAGFVAILVLGLGVIVALKFLIPILLDKKQKATSDAGEVGEVIRIGIDNWAGYYPLCSQKMRQRMRGAGYKLKCEDDGADYPGRMKKLHHGDLDFAVATVDSFILNGVSEDFPGSIIMVIDESKGGDAILSKKNKVASLDDLKKKTNIKVAFTPASPSEHLLKAISSHFDIPALRVRNGNWRVEKNGSEEALKLFLAGGVDVAVLWEPDVSKALANKDVVRLIGTENTDKLIVDILLVSRDFLRDKPEVVTKLLSNYFVVLKHYKDNPDDLVDELKKKTGLNKDQVDAMIKGVAWVNLDENASKWFGVSSSGGFATEGLIETIDSAVQILTDYGDFQKNPIPDEDPYRLVLSDIISNLYANGIRGQFGVANTSPLNSQFAGSSLEKEFAALNDKGWNALREVGTLKVRPIIFMSGRDLLSYQGKLELDKVVENLKHYPDFRVLIKGHTSLRGDPQANKDLSLRRAAVVEQYLTVTYGVNSNRIRAIGLGADQPLTRKPGESSRAYNYRLPRVELNLVSEVY